MPILISHLKFAFANEGAGVTYEANTQKIMLCGLFFNHYIQEEARIAF